MFYGVTDIWTYALGALFIVLLPGPNSLYVMAVASREGVAAGYRGACGIFLGDTLLMILSATGAASLLRAGLPLRQIQAAGDHPLQQASCRRRVIAGLAMFGKYLDLGSARRLDHADVVVQSQRALVLALDREVYAYSNG